MSIYSALGFEEPTIAYSALHQVRKGVQPKVYRQTMADFHRLLHEETKKVNESWKTYREESIARSIHSARSLLLQYLTTPLKSDTDEIQRILREKITDFATASLTHSPLGMLTTSEGRIIDAGGRALNAGAKRYLDELGFNTGRPRRDMYESVFVVSGGHNLDVIEHIVRDRIGIYTPVHGKHIGEFDSYSYGAHNLVFLEGPLSAPARFEVTTYFSKGGVKYDLFRTALREIVSELMKTIPVAHGSLWQRKLGLGSGKEFVLRFHGDDLGSLVEIAKLLQTKAQQPFLRQPLKGGSVLCKEFVRE